MLYENKQNILACLVFILPYTPITAQRMMEQLDRGTVAVRRPDGKVFVSWRLLGTDPANISFNIYRAIGNGKPEKINKQPISAVTSFLDINNDTIQPRTYQVRVLIKGKENGDQKSFVLKAGNRPYISIALQTPGLFTQ